MAPSSGSESVAFRALGDLELRVEFGEYEIEDGVHRLEDTDDR